MRLRNECQHDVLIAYACKGRGVRPSCNKRRMVETAAHLADHGLPSLPVRQDRQERRGASLVFGMVNGDVSEQQGVWHAHRHVIQRYEGEVPSPRGGVRGVVPFKANY